MFELNEKNKSETLLIDSINAQNIGCEYGEYDNPKSKVLKKR